MLIEYEKKGKKVRSLEAMPLYLKEQLNTDEKAKKLIKQIYNYVIKDGAEIVPLSECFK